MKTFDLPAESRLKLISVTNRKETHGKELVQAISLRLEWWPPDNASLNILHPNLQDMLFWTPPDASAQAQLEVVAPVKKHLRCPTVAQPFKVPNLSFSGYTLTIEHGIDDSTALELYGCSLDKFETEVKDGGSCAIRFSLASNKQITRELMGALCDMERSEVVATLTPPDENEQPAGGGTHGGGDLFPEGDDTDAGQEGSGVIDGTNRDGDWPFPQTPEGALAAAVGADGDDTAPGALE